MSDPAKGPLSVRQIHDALTVKAVRGRFLDPLKVFFKEMELEWADVPTAQAFRRGKKPTIQLGRRFFATEVKSHGEAADVVYHEIMHHLLRHLFLMQGLEKKGYPHWVQNLAMDAIINAHLESVGCAEFMERFYPDKGEMAFLRPRSKDFNIAHGFWRWRKIAPVHRVSTSKAQEFYAFYKKLYALKMTLEESLEFFKKHFPKESKDCRFLGKHAGSGSSSEQPEQNPAQGKPEETQDQKPSPSSSAQDEGKEPRDNQSGGDKDQPPAPSSSSSEGDKDWQPSSGKSSDEVDSTPGSGGPLFDEDEARQILQELKILPREVSRKTSDNFAEIIRKVATTLVREGSERAEIRITRRLPAKLDRHDVLNIERERYLFRRSDFRLREVVLFPDISGSMDAYIPFMVGLIGRLRKADLVVRTICWASKPVEVPFTDVLQGKLPAQAGRGGTDGESLARFIEKEKIRQAVIITDNAAGQIQTRINARVQLCLVEGAADHGSFLDRRMVPHLAIHQLKLKAN
jgi:hypothetical protein